MWLCLNNSFVSAIEHRDKPEYLIVRARRYEHLANIFPDRIDDIFTMTTSDYAWRIEVTKVDFAKLISNSIMNINYHNFKNSVDDEELKNMYSQVWWLGLMMQESENWEDYDEDDAPGYYS